MTCSQLRRGRSVAVASLRWPQTSFLGAAHLPNSEFSGMELCRFRKKHLRHSFVIHTFKGESPKIGFDRNQCAIAHYQVIIGCPLTMVFYSHESMTAKLVLAGFRIRIIILIQLHTSPIHIWPVVQPFYVSLTTQSMPEQVLSTTRNLKRVL